jgi:hypothetical protein
LENFAELLKNILNKSNGKLSFLFQIKHQNLIHLEKKRVSIPARQSLKKTSEEKSSNRSSVKRQKTKSTVSINHA